MNEMTAANLRSAFGGESQARMRYIVWGKKAEADKIHAAMFTEAKQAVDSGEDMELDDVQICSVYGHTTQGEAPGRCPVCNQPPEVFVAFRK